jgi:ribonuclease HI
MVVKIYTDGACSGNPGPGGWAAILTHGNTEKVLSGFEAETTNNRMELLAAISGLAALKAPRKFATELYSDSTYVVNAVNNGWLTKWKLNAWKTADKKPVKNQDLWAQFDELLESVRPKLVWVKGHASNEFNNRCDELAVAEIAKRKKAAEADVDHA